MQTLYEGQDKASMLIQQKAHDFVYSVKSMEWRSKFQPPPPPKPQLSFVFSFILLMHFAAYFIIQKN